MAQCGQRDLKEWPKGAKGTPKATKGAQRTSKGSPRAFQGVKRSQKSDQGKPKVLLSHPKEAEWKRYKKKSSQSTGQPDIVFELKARPIDSHSTMLPLAGRTTTQKAGQQVRIDVSLLSLSLSLSLSLYIMLYIRHRASGRKWSV